MEGWSSYFTQFFYMTRFIVHYVVAHFSPPQWVAMCNYSLSEQQNGAIGEWKSTGTLDLWSPALYQSPNLPLTLPRGQTYWRTCLWLVLGLSCPWPSRLDSQCTGRSLQCWNRANRRRSLIPKVCEAKKYSEYLYILPWQCVWIQHDETDIFPVCCNQWNNSAKSPSNPPRREEAFLLHFNYFTYREDLHHGLCRSIL